MTVRRAYRQLRAVLETLRVETSRLLRNNNFRRLGIFKRAHKACKPAIDVFFGIRVQLKVLGPHYYFQLYLPSDTQMREDPEPGALTATRFRVLTESSDSVRVEGIEPPTQGLGRTRSFPRVARS